MLLFFLQSLRDGPLQFSGRGAITKTKQHRKKTEKKTCKQSKPPRQKYMKNPNKCYIAEVRKKSCLEACPTIPIEKHWSVPPFDL